MAVLQGKSIKEYVLGRVLSPSFTEGDSASDEALKQLEAFLEPRIKEAEMGKVLNKSVETIFNEVSVEIGKN